MKRGSFRTRNFLIPVLIIENFTVLRLAADFSVVNISKHPYTQTRPVLHVRAPLSSGSLVTPHAAGTFWRTSFPSRCYRHQSSRIMHSSFSSSSMQMTLLRASSPAPAPPGAGPAAAADADQPPIDAEMVLSIISSSDMP
jgi:hypothetical protein